MKDKINELTPHMPEIMRVVRAMLLIFLTFDYPMAGKCLVVVLFVEVLVWKKRYDREFAIFLNVVLLGLSFVPDGSYFLVNCLLHVCLFVYFLQLFIRLGSLALQHVDFLRENEKISGEINIKIRYLVLATVIFVTGEFGLIVWPYRDTPKVTEHFKVSFKVEDFYADEVSCDRAAVIEESVQALAYRISIIENTKSEILMSAYEFDADTAGKRIISSLMQAAKRGVKVKLILDGYYSVTEADGNPYFMALARCDNVEIKVYNEASLLTPWKGLGRMHEKYLVADDEVFILGDRDISDSYMGKIQTDSYGDRDILVYNTGGEESAVHQLKTYFYTMWEDGECDEWDAYLFSGVIPSIHSAETDLDWVHRTMNQEEESWFEKLDYEKITVPTDKITLLSNPIDTSVKEPQILYGLSQLMENAKTKIDIHAPNIIADTYMYEVLRGASNNAHVTLVTNSPRSNEDMFWSVDYVMNKGKILGTGVELLEYVGETEYQANSIVIDDDISIIGSFDLNHRNTYNNTGLMVVVDSKEFNKILDDYQFMYEKSTAQATVEKDELDVLLKGKSIGEMLKGSIIKMIDEHFRFLF